MIAAATSMVPATMTGPTALGRMWRTTWRNGRRPEAARRLDELLLAQRQELGADEPRHRHPAEAPDHHHDQDEDARLGAERLLQGVAEEVHDQEQERELGQRQEESVIRISVWSIDPAGMAGDAPRPPCPR